MYNEDVDVCKDDVSFGRGIYYFVNVLRLHARGKRCLWRVFQASYTGEEIPRGERKIMSDKYQMGMIAKDVPLKETIGQLFHCNHCLGINVFCTAISAYNQYFIILGKCNDCGKETNFAITSAPKDELMLNEEEWERKMYGFSV